VAPNLLENARFSMKRDLRIMNYVQVFVHKGVITSVKRVEFLSDRMSYIYIYMYNTKRWLESLF
jgi:hypothetical protein